MTSMTAPAASLRIVVVDDDEEVRHALRYLLVSCGHRGQLFASAEELLDEQVAADWFFFDICLPELSGLELAHRIRQSGSDAPIVLMTGQDTETTRTAVLDSGLPVIWKPFGEEEVLSAMALRR